jgi:hypothetical protein
MLSRSRVDLAIPVDPRDQHHPPANQVQHFADKHSTLKKSATSMPGVIPSSAPDENPLRVERVQLLLVSVLQNAVVEAGAAALYGKHNPKHHIRDLCSPRGSFE